MLFAYWSRTITALLLFCVVIHTSAVAAQSLTAQQTQLADSEDRLKALKYREKLLTSQLKDNKAQLAPLEKQDSPEKEALNTSKALRDNAAENYQSDPTPDNKAKMTNADFKYLLAERKYKKAHAQLFKLQQKTESLTQKLATTSKDIAALTGTIGKQRQAINLQKSQLEQQNKVAQQQKQRAADKEIQRLKAELAQQKQLQQQQEAKQKARDQQQLEAQKQRQAKLAAAAATATAAPAPTPSPTPAPTGAEKKPTDSKASASNNTTNRKSILLGTIKQVRAEEARLNKLLAKRKKKRSRYNKRLNIKTVQKDGSISKPQANTLRALGHSQFKAVVKLKGGEYVFAVGFKTWREVIPHKPGGTEYVFIYNSTNNRRPTMVYFNKSLASR